MTFRNRIETQFEGKAFVRPLFYTYPGGLRFELSESGSALEQFLLAMRKATEICLDVFNENSVLTVCLRCYVDNKNPFAYRSILTELREAGVVPSKQRELWLETTEEGYMLNVAFEAHVSLLPNLLWCALVSDFGSIHPHPQCLIYLFDLESGLLVWPYDNRGMDVVGLNRQKLIVLYHKYSSCLLDYDRAEMNETFRGE